MTIPPDLEAQILRYHHVEKWRVGTIAGQLRVHHSVVTRVLAQAGLPRIGPPARPSQIDAYLAFIHQTLGTFARACGVSSTATPVAATWTPTDARAALAAASAAVSAAPASTWLT